MGKAMMPASVIADLVCQEIGDNTGAKKFLILQYLTMGWQEMKIFLNIEKTIRTDIFDIGNKTQFEISCGFMFETKVGVRKKRCGNRPQGKLSVLRLNTDMEVSTIIMNDTDTLNSLSKCMDEPEEDTCDCYFYNSPCGVIKGYGTGFAKNHYYSIQDGVIAISPSLNMSHDMELVVEYVSDVFSEGLTLVPSEAFACLHAFAQARYNQEGVVGKWQNRYEAQFNSLNRLYNFRSIDLLTELFTA